ncbi:hypothetical protein [Terriglobus albidus]|uniref:hypothetical protein n=1 Tax=Terriglobus albidus TaxID=1592106 RepID=UPI0021E08673|nr:hypothetical protein [Terriglobus albidus]
MVSQPGMLRRWWKNAGASAGSGVLLLLLPKCPFCIAAYLAVWMGGGAAMSIATQARPVLELLFAASLILLAVRFWRQPPGVVS